MRSILDAGIIQKILATMADDAIINLLLSGDTAVQRMLKKQKNALLKLLSLILI